MTQPALDSRLQAHDKADILSRLEGSRKYSNRVCELIGEGFGRDEAQDRADAEVIQAANDWIESRYP